MIPLALTEEISSGIIYAQTLLPHPDGSILLARTVQKFLNAILEDTTPEILWTLSYTKQVPRSLPSEHCSDKTPSVVDPITEHRSRDQSITMQSRIIKLPELGLDLALDDSVLEEVKAAWKKIVGEEEAAKGFMLFEDRSGENEGNNADDTGDVF